MGSDCAVHVEHVSKRFRRLLAVNDVSFEIPRGCVCGLVGPNGAGKTTTLQMLLDLLRPDSGKIRVLGMDPVEESLEIRRHVGYVPEAHHIYGWMKIRQVLKFVSLVYPTWSTEECGRVNEILKLPMERKVKQLSRGELAKLALIVALGHKPPLLILDEPTSGLDPLVRREFLECIIQLLADQDRTVFFSTHILSDVERVADQLLVMQNGRLVMHDSLKNFCGRYSRVSFLFAHSPDVSTQVPGAVRIVKGLREWVAVFEASSHVDPSALAAQLGAESFVTERWAWRTRL